MVTEGTKRPQVSIPMPAPPRKINVQKYAESRALELQSLQCIIENRVNNDYKSQRNKRRRTTAFDNQIARKGCRRKRQRLGTVDKGHGESVLGKKQIKKLPRRVRRRYELKMNPENGFCTSGDGTKRLRTHVWHAKRFAMTKLWGYHLPLGLQGRGKGSRALLKRLKHGVLIHDASYYTAVQLEGPEDSLVSVLQMVLVPFPGTVTHPGNHDDSDLSGVTYGTAMLYQIGAPVSQPIAPVTYIWRPTFQQNTSTEQDGRNYNTCGQHDISDESHGSSFRHLWVWIHASAFEEGYNNLKLACQKEMEKRGFSINCFSLEGQLAKLELMGSGTFQLLQKILHPVSVSENNWQLKKHVAIEEDCICQSSKSSLLKNQEHFSSRAMLSLNIKDPRELPGKRTVVPTEPISTKELSDAQETNYEELADLGDMLKKSKDLPSLSWSKHEDSQSNIDDLWYAQIRGLRPPVKESVLSKEKHRERMLNFCLDDIDSGEADSSTEVQCSRSCPILLLKNDFKESIIGWSVILPLSWVKAFWIPLISNGAHAIGLREKHWIACEMGIPFFPSDFPDCKAYSSFMEAKAASFNEKEELRPPSRRHLRVPTLPPWGIVRITFNKEISAMETSEPSTREDLTNVNSSRNSCPGNFKIPNFDSDNNSFDGIVARTGCMLTTFINETKASQLLLFPCAADGNAIISKFINGEQKLDLTHRSSVIYDHKLCFLRVHLHPFKKGFFEEGAVICAPYPSDISLWTSSSEKSEEGLQMSQSAMRLYFKEHSSGEWEMQIPDDSSHRWPIGFVTTSCVQGSKRLVAEGFCEAVLLSHLRKEQWKEIPTKQRRREIYVLVRNLRSVAYRLALASVVLEFQENDIDFL
ncbi:ribonucleases P/MRP protein subunit POP1 isoform X2 [Gastrolobium bilobum]|uniref:ribonucleases P/MRP protein subunit POP1 isoform X2 n=1 Tax=Gastrolobium bilobum TaxID=150636 RepID=UPI002AAF43DE|nr:ribonucleases P/MRP protein subunit POP1 isoform X2 [Gastrolobium bilobum]